MKSVQGSSLVEGFSLKVGAIVRRFRNTKQEMGFHLQDQDSSSTQSTGKSNDGVGCFKDNNPYSSFSGYDQSTSNAFVVHARSASIVSQDSMFSSSLACLPLTNSEPCIGTFLAATYTPYPTVNHTELMSLVPGLVQSRVLLPKTFMQNEPMYVNAKQYHAILRRRQHRAKLEAQNKLLKVRKPYLHESRHLHALKRARGSDGRFLNRKKPEKSRPNSTSHNQVFSGESQFFGDLIEYSVPQLENRTNGNVSRSSTLCSDVSTGSNSWSRFGFSGLSDKAVDGSGRGGGGSNGGNLQRHISVLM